MSRTPLSVGLAGLICCLLFTACGGDAGNSSPHPTFDTRATLAPQDLSAVGLETPAAFVTAPPVAGDTTVILAPKMYPDPADPCYGQQKTVGLMDASPACTTAWQMVAVVKVPGEDLTQASTIPHNAQIAAGIPLAEGKADAEAYAHYEVVSTFTILNNYVDATKAIDTPSYVPYDRILQRMLHGATVTEVPSCSEPSSIRLTRITPDVRDYLIQLGWPQPSTTAIVSNFPACPGILFQYQGSQDTRLFGNNAAATTVTTGSIHDIPPFGKVWVIDGYGICGVPKLKPVCGI